MDSAALEAAAEKTGNSYDRCGEPVTAAASFIKLRNRWSFQIEGV